jgi:tetratricopeptide (TPR) repeat protein
MQGFDEFVGRRRFLGICFLGAMALASGCGGSVEPEELVVFKEAMAAVAAGDKAKGMELLNQCLEIKPSHYAYLERARLRMEAKEVPQAIDDCKKGLELDPQNSELQWLLSQLEKPEGQRFKGPDALPPASRK